MEYWRERILQSTLWISLLLATIAYVPGVWAALNSGLGWLVAIDTAAWAGILILALWHSLAFTIRALLFLTSWFIFALLLLWLLGPMGAGTLWLLAVPILAALFFGYRGALGGAGLLVVVTVVFYFLLPLRQSMTYMPQQDMTYDAVSWLASAGTLLFLALLLSQALAELLRRLDDTLQALDHSNQRLKRIMEEREMLQDRILQDQKQSALGTLSAGIAHDFNNLLVPILMASEQAREDAPDESRQSRHLDAVIHSAERARLLVRRILDYSLDKKDAEYHPVRIEPVLREAAGLLRSSAPASIEFRYDIRDAGATAIADAGKVHQILMNLGTNASLAMPDGGCLSWHLHGPDADHQIRIDVCDTGTGIPADVQSRIFDPFFTTRRPGSGTGLGLSIVHRLVTAMNGRVEVESDGESGSCFYVYLPAASSVAPATARMAPGPADDTEQMPGRILVVDDEELVRGTLVMTLTHLGYTVEGASTPESALRQLHESPQRYQLVLTDLAMPGMNGILLVERIRQLLPSLPVVMLSGHFTDEDRQALRQLDVTSLLGKPFSRAELAEAVQKALAP
ncbi:MAG: response regulator [Pseudohongiellaceae bacterium]